MSAVILAIDPGLSGAGSVVHVTGTLVATLDLPTRRRINTAGLGDLVRERGPYAFAIVEQVSAMPGNGVSGMFKFGQTYGTILGVLGALAIPVRHVAPSTWKRALGLNNDGETSRARAIETWPDHADLFARKKDHNRAEAALLGLYGLREGRNV
jgi:crossover junction endodeoxyribonuclease RuvC